MSTMSTMLAIARGVDPVDRAHRLDRRLERLDFNLSYLCRAGRLVDGTVGVLAVRRAGTFVGHGSWGSLLALSRDGCDPS